MSSISSQGPAQPIRPMSTSQPSQPPASPSSPATSSESAVPSEAPPASATDSSDVQQAPESNFSPGGGLFSPETRASEPAPSQSEPTQSPQGASEPAPSQSEPAPDYMSKAPGQALPDSHQDAARAAHENLLNVMAARDARNLDKLSEDQLFRQMKEAIQNN